MEDDVDDQMLSPGGIRSPQTPPSPHSPLRLSLLPPVPHAQQHHDVLRRHGLLRVGVIDAVGSSHQEVGGYLQDNSYRREYFLIHLIPIFFFLSINFT